MIALYIGLYLIIGAVLAGFFTEDFDTDWFIVVFLWPVLGICIGLSYISDFIRYLRSFL
jgi:hypothetical protein